MGSTTTKGYPYPVGTDRVMDGDDAIKALAEAVDSDSAFTRATTLGQTLVAATANNISWNAASPNGCELTKTSAYQWTVTVAGLYVVTAVVQLGAFQPSGTRAYIGLSAGPGVTYYQRDVMSGENTATTTMLNALAPGDQIIVTLFPNTATGTVSNAGFLHVARLGRN
jgi:hypothetical protein